MPDHGEVKRFELDGGRDDGERRITQELSELRETAQVETLAALRAPRPSLAQDP